MNMPLKMESKLQAIINAWLQEDAPVSTMMSVTAEHKDALVKRLRNHIEDELYKAYDDGFNDARETR